MRVAVRLAAFGGLTLVASLVWLGGWACVWYSARWQRRWRGLAFRAWAKSVLRLFGIKLLVSGNPPAAPFFLVANHLSYVDILVLAAQLDCIFVAKSEVATWPVFGWLSRQMHTIFIDRQRKRDLLRVNALLAQALQAGESLVLFPEGTTTAGEQVLPFKSGLLEPVVRASRRVSYASLRYRTAASEPSAAEVVCWWGEMEFVPHLLQLFAVPGFEAILRFGDETLLTPERKTLAKCLHAAVTQGVALLNEQFQENPDSSGRRELEIQRPSNTTKPAFFNE